MNSKLTDERGDIKIPDEISQRDNLAEATENVPANLIGPPYTWSGLMKWARQIFRDPELTPTDKFIAVYLWLLHLNRNTGQLNPSLKTIAEETRTAKKTIVESRDRLQRRGHLDFEPGRAGRGISTRYWPCLWRVQEKVSDTKPFAGQKKGFPSKTFYSTEKRFPRGSEKVSVEPKKVSHEKPEPKNHIKNLSAPNGDTSAGALARGAERRSRAGARAAEIKPTIRQVPRGPEGNPNGDQGRLHAEIAEALGERGWEILIALPDERWQLLYDSYRKHGLASDELFRLKAEAIFSSPPQEPRRTGGLQ